jgi:hypothetical protein
MIRMQNYDEKADLLSQVLEVVIDTHWLLWLHVVEGRNGDEVDIEERYSYLLPIDSTLHQVKQLLHMKRGILPQDQRWSDAEGRLVLYGPIFYREEGEEAPSTMRTLNLHIDPIDIHLEAFFGMLSLESVEERDKMMHDMTISRNPRQCTGGHNLSDIVEEMSYSLECAKCHFIPDRNRTTWVVPGRGRERIELKLMTCHQCAKPFYLCTACYPKDEGRPASADPYEQIVQHVVKLATQRASIAGWFGGRGHWCGYPPITWRSEFGPKKYLAFRHDQQVKITRETQVVHPGARLVVRLSSELQSIVGEEIVSNLAVETIVGRGATVGELTHHRRIPSNVWPQVNSYYQNLHPDYTSRIGEQPDTYATMRLVSFGVEQVIYEVGATIVDGDY